MNKRTRSVVVLGLLISVIAGGAAYYIQNKSAIGDLADELSAAAVKSVASTTLATKATAGPMMALPVGSAKLTTLPLGDKKYVTTGAKKGMIYVCNVASGGGGAQVVGSWIHGTSWTPGEKIYVQGSVSWPKATYSMTNVAGMRNIKSNGLPVGLTTGTFPVAATDPAAAIDRNPGSIGAQSYSFSLPQYPAFATTPNCIYGEVGIMTNGVVLLDGLDAEYRDAPAHEVEDTCYGHPHDSTYHYHSLSPCMKNASISNVMGYAFDGFPITGNQLPSGKYVTSSDLDECHGMTSTIMLDGKSVLSYHYVLTQDFPYSVSCFKGKSYEPKPEQGGPQSKNTSTGGVAAPANVTSAGGQMTPPIEAIAACSTKVKGDSCSFTTPSGSITGMCDTPPGQSMACVPKR